MLNATNESMSFGVTSCPNSVLRNMCFSGRLKCVEIWGLTQPYKIGS